MTAPLIFPGDVFCVDGGDKVVPAAIRLVERIWSKDGKAQYNHAGIITSASGDTFEAVAGTVSARHLDRYRGKEMLIARPVMTVTGAHITQSAKQRAMEVCIRDHDGQVYPAWRLLLHMVPVLGKIGCGRFLVCSELTEKYLSMIHADDRMILGINPDDLADAFQMWWNFKKVYEGVWQ